MTGLASRSRKIAGFGPLIAAALALTQFSYPALSQSNWEKRDEWQRPQQVMDALGLEEGSAVADVGSRRGYFVYHLAARVGTTGKVYAVDINEDPLESIRRRAESESLTQIATIHSKTDDPMLPEESLDAILVVNAYHEFRAYDEMMQGMFKGLKPGGRIAIIDSPTERSDSRSTYYSKHDIPEEVVKEDAARAGFRFLRNEPGFTRSGRRGTKFYFLLFEKPKDSLPATLQ